MSVLRVLLSLAAAMYDVLLVMVFVAYMLAPAATPGPYTVTPESSEGGKRVSVEISWVLIAGAVLNLAAIGFGAGYVRKTPLRRDDTASTFS